MAGRVAKHVDDFSSETAVPKSAPLNIKTHASTVSKFDERRERESMRSNYAVLYYIKFEGTKLVSQRACTNCGNQSQCNIIILITKQSFSLWQTPTFILFLDY